MRRIAQSLAVAGAIIGMGLSALPAGASTLSADQVAARAHPAQSSPTPAQRQAAARAAKLAALRSHRGVITGILRSSSGAPEAGVCVVATGLLATRKVFTQPDGRYMIAGLPLGAYRVEYRGCSPIGRFTGQWYGGLTRTSAAKVNVTGAAPTELAPVTLGMISPRFDRVPARRQLSAAAPAGQAVSQLVSKLESGQTVQAPAQAGRIAHISGRVTNRAGHPLAKVCVLATAAGGNGFEFLARTLGTGRYRLRVRPGRYDVTFLPTCARHGNYAPQVWKGAGSAAKATVLRVKAGQVVTNIDAKLGVGAVITGRVRTNHNPHPSFRGLCADAIGLGEQHLFLGLSTTRSDGTFRIPSLATGQYRIFIFSCTSTSPYLPVIVRKPVAVTDGKTTSGVTAVLTLGGTITGTVKDSNGKALPGICSAAVSNNQYYQATTQSNGSYKIVGIAAGSYQMQFSTGCGNKGPYAPVTLPSPVTVAPGKVTSHVDAVLPFDGTLTGVVKNSHGQPLGGICVVAQGSNFGFAFARTAADGTYTAKKVPPGSYQVQFIPGGVFSDCGNKGNYLPATESATVTSQVTSTANAVLPTGGVISGVVKDPHGKPLAGVCAFSNSPYGGLAVSRSDGSYQLRQLFSGGYFTGFEGGCGNQESVAPRAYRGDPTFYGPATISVTAGQVTSGINVGMRPGATVRGHITDQAGQSVGGVCVLVLGVTGAGGFGNFGAFVIDHGGRYSASNLPPGQYNVAFSGLSVRHRGCGRSPYADQQFSGVGFGARPDLVSAAGGKVTTGVNAVLSLAGTISGVVADKAGRGIPGLCVTATDPRTGTTAEGFQRPARHLQSDRAPGRALSGGVLELRRRVPLLRRDRPELCEPVVQGPFQAGRSRFGGRAGKSDHAQYRRGSDAGRVDQRPGRLQAQSAAGQLRLRLCLHVQPRQHQRRPDRPARSLHDRRAEHGPLHRGVRPVCGRVGASRSAQGRPRTRRRRPGRARRGRAAAARRIDLRRDIGHPAGRVQARTRNVHRCTPAEPDGQRLDRLLVPGRQLHGHQPRAGPVRAPGR